MDHCEVKEFKVSRGYTYSYLRYKNPDRTRPTLLLLHGFPSTSNDWIHQINYLIPKGYSIIAPDALGYGGSSKPVQVSEYRFVDTAKDTIELLSHENLEKVVGVSHDWGHGILSRLVDDYRRYLTAAVFMSVSYVPLPQKFDYEATMKLTESLFGYPLYGYWEYFSNPDAAAVIEKNIDSFYSILFPRDPELMKTVMALRGNAQKWLEGNKQAPNAEYWTDESLKAHQHRLLSGGLTAPLNYYKAYMAGIQDDSDPVPDEARRFSTPTLLIVPVQDFVCLKEIQVPRMQKFAENLEVEEFDCGHWVMFEKTEELNERLGRFLEKF